MPLQLARYRPWMKSLRLWLPAVLFVVVATPLKVSHAQEANNVVAVVNADPITRKTLSDEAVKRYGGDVLDNMVNRHLILQECTHQGVEVTKQEVSEEIRRLASKFGLSLESYLQLLQEERNISPGQYSREIVWPMLALRRLVADKVEVTDQEYNKAFIAQFGEAVKCRLIMVADRSKAMDVHKQASANPGMFSSLAKKYSEDEASASVGGLIPPIRRFSGDSRLEEAAFALETGGVSSVMQLGDQWIFLQAVRRIPASNPSPQAMPAIGEQIKDRIRDEKMRGAASELFAGLQQEARVVKVIGNVELTKQHPGVAAIINGEQISIAVVGAECIKRHGDDVLEGEVNRMLLSQALRSAKTEVTQADIDAEISAAAVRYGFVRSNGAADLDAWIESVTESGETTKEVYIADAVWPSVALKKLVEGQVQLTDQDMQEGYQAAYGPRVEVLAIVLSDQRSAQKIWEMARDNPTDDFFGKLAEQYSVEPVSASNQGKVPPVRKFGGQPAIEKEAFALKPGELSGIVATGGKYLILRCQGFTEPVVTDPEAVREELVRDLSETKLNRAMADRFEELRESAEIDTFLQVAAKAQVATRP
ncbi:MAG: peptidylprolyl isomerase [Rubripirellula sp.]